MVNEMKRMSFNSIKDYHFVVDVLTSFLAITAFNSIKDYLDLKIIKETCSCDFQFHQGLS